MARKIMNGLDLQSQRIQNVLDPSSAQDAATKAYVDNTAAGLDQKASVRVASTANLTLSGTQTIDGIACIAGDRVLAKNQTTGSENGLYAVAAGSWSRTTDADVSSEVTAGMLVIVEEGTVSGPGGSGGGNVFILTTTNPITLGSTTLTFTRYSVGVTYTASLGVALSGNDFRLAAGSSGAGLTLTSGVLDFVAADTSLTVNADSAQVRLAASGGLQVASGLAVDSTVARVFQTGTHSSGTSIPITHSLGKQFVCASIYITSTGEQIFPDITATSTTVTTFAFGVSQSANSLTFVIHA